MKTASIPSSVMAFAIRISALFIPVFLFAETPSPPTPEQMNNANAWVEVRQQLKAFQNGPLARALMYPFEPSVQSVLQQLDLELTRLKGPPPPPVLTAAASADRFRWVGYFALSKASLLRKIAEHRSGLDAQKERRGLALLCLEATKEAHALLTSLQDSTHPEHNAALMRWIGESSILNHLHFLASHAHATLWAEGGGASHKQAALHEWSMINPSYKHIYPPGTPEMEQVLGVVSVAGTMTSVAWVGIAMLSLALVLSLVRRNLDLFQQWVLRSFIALGAAMTATVIPGVLNINIDRLVAAGGTLAIIVLIYLFNPPHLREPQNGNPPPAPAAPPPAPPQP